MVRLERGEGHGERGWGWWSGQCYNCLVLEKFLLGKIFAPFTNTQMPKEKGERSKRNTPGALHNRSVAARARPLPGYEWCWCRGFNIGCGSVRSWKTCQQHAHKERRLRNGNYDKIIYPMFTRLLTFQFPESQAQLLVDFLADSINKFNVEDIEDC